MKTILENRKTLIITFLSAVSYFIIPSLLGSGKEQGFGLFLISLLLVSVFGFVSLILIFIAHFRRRRQSKIAIIGAGLLVSFMFLISAFFAVNYLMHGSLPAGSDARRFNSKTWKANSSVLPNEGTSVREQMLEDVVENVLPNKTKHEIVNALGPSRKTAYFSEIDKDLIYYLGPERGPFGIDSEWLLVWLDKNGKFEKYEIVND